MTGNQHMVESLLRQDTPVTFTALGPSMHPVIADGSHVRVQPVRSAVLRNGSVILYAAFGRLVLHRCIQRDANANRLGVAADAALEGLDWIDPSDVLGVAEWVLRNGCEVRLDTRRARGAGLLRYYTRPLRRLALAILKHPAS